MIGTVHLSTRRSQREKALSRRALKTLTLPLGILCLAAAFPALFLMGRAGPDLFDCTPRSPRVEGYILVAWYDLERGAGPQKDRGPSAGSPTRVLGYMMDGDQPTSDGQKVNRFVLLPDAGTAVHPAHRLGDQMIDVQLDAGTSVVFKERSLAWAWGTWGVLAGNPSGDRPLYRLQNARVEKAEKAEIEKYFW